MASVPRTSSGPTVGDTVVLLCQTDDRPLWTTGQVNSELPFVVEVDAKWQCEFHAPCPLVLIHDSGRCIFKAVATVENRAEQGNRATLTFGKFKWDMAESRDHPRYKVDAQATVRCISDNGAGVEMEDQVAQTKNMSVGGALIRVGKPIQIGSLVEFNMALEYGQSVRTLGVAAHSNEAGTLIGLNFIDYAGKSRSNLDQFLGRLAA